MSLGKNWDYLRKQSDFREDLAILLAIVNASNFRAEASAKLKATGNRYPVQWESLFSDLQGAEDFRSWVIGDAAHLLVKINEADWCQKVAWLIGVVACYGRDSVVQHCTAWLERRDKYLQQLEKGQKLRSEYHAKMIESWMAMLRSQLARKPQRVVREELLLIQNTECAKKSQRAANESDCFREGGLDELADVRSLPPETEAQRVETIHRVREAVKALLPPQREVIQLCHFEGMTQQEVATALKLSPEQVKAILAAARKALNKLLKPLSGER